MFSLVKVLVPVIVLLVAVAVMTPAAPTTYASVPAAITESPEPATQQPQQPTDVPQQPTDVPQQPTDVPQQPTTVPQRPTNTRRPDQGGDKKGVEISLRKVANTSEVAIGGTVEFTLVVNNTGDEIAQNVVVSDPLPAFLQLVGATADRGSVTITGNTVTVDIGPVGPGDTVTIRVTATLVSAPPPPPNNRNIATLTTTSTDNVQDNLDSVEIRLPGTANTDQQQPTSPPATDTPLPGVTTTVVPTLVPTATPPQPVSLPPTGGTSSGAGFWLLLAAVGAGSLTLGALLRRRKA